MITCTLVFVCVLSFDLCLFTFNVSFWVKKKFMLVFVIYFCIRLDIYVLYHVL